MLAVVSRFKWIHIDYLAALAEEFELLVVWSDDGHAGAAAQALSEGMNGYPIGALRDVGVVEIRTRLRDAISAWRPDVVHVMYYDHEELTLLVRELVDDCALLVYECRDPLTTLTVERGDPLAMDVGSNAWALEDAALRAADMQIFVSEAVRSYLERSHGLDLRATSLIVPQGFARRTIGPPSPKLSAEDGRLHLALVGTASDLPDHSRWYVDIIRRLVSLDLVVHSHFHDLPGVSLEPYEALARELDDYHHHPTVPSRIGTALSKLISRYDLIGVFHELHATGHYENPNLAVCLPTKAVCGWLHGGIPVVCFPHYQGIVERIRELRIGFVIESWEGLRRVAADRPAIAGATERCLACRDSFTNEHNAARIRAFLEPRIRRADEHRPRGELVQHG
jgi:hypothetical protein